MRFQALACDYDGTLATHGHVGEDIVAALKTLRRSGRKLLMVTGRRLEELLTVFNHAALFDWIVAENGALLYRPATKEEVVLAEPPLPEFIQLLKSRGVTPIEVGRVIVATWTPHETTVLEVIRDLGLGMQIILNKGAVMVLPADVSKATGLRHALDKMGISPHNVASVGDAENDHALLAIAECGVAVANALEAVKLRADVVTVSDHGAGVAELIAQLVQDDLASWAPRLNRHAVTLGTAKDGQPFRLASVGATRRIVARSADSLARWVNTFLTALSAAGYQWTLVTDATREALAERRALPEGETPAASNEEAFASLIDPQRNAVIHCTSQNDSERIDYLQSLIPQLTELWSNTGRPHWVVWMDAASLLRGAEVDFAALTPKHGVMLAQVADRPEPIAAPDAPPFVEEGVDVAMLDGRPSEALRYRWESDQLVFAAADPVSTAPAPITEKLL